MGKPAPAEWKESPQQGLTYTRCVRKRRTVATKDGCKGAKGTEGTWLCCEMGTQEKIMDGVRQKDSLLLTGGKPAPLIVKDWVIHSVLP